MRFASLGHDEGMQPLLVVDGDNLAHRAYHSTPKSVKAPDGAPINAIVGFFGMLTRLWEAERPRGIFVAWDTLGVETYRNKLWPAYQSGREFDREIVLQLDRLPDLCRSCGLGVGKTSGFEADDLMASAALKEVEQGGAALLFTTDKDSYQLVSERIMVISPQRGTRELSRIGPLQVVERMGVLPQQIPDFKALSGDSSDKIPGIRGIGPKAAASLLLKHGTLDAVIANWDRTADAELALMFREVATMRPEVEVALPQAGPNWQAGAQAMRAVGANNLADRLASLT